MYKAKNVEEKKKRKNKVKKKKTFCVDFIKVWKGSIYEIVVIITTITLEKVNNQKFIVSVLILKSTSL